MSRVNCHFSFPLPTSSRLAVRNNLKKVSNYWKSPLFCLKKYENPYAGLSAFPWNFSFEMSVSGVRC